MRYCQPPLEKDDCPRKTSSYHQLKHGDVVRAVPCEQDGAIGIEVARQNRPTALERHRGLSGYLLLRLTPEIPGLGRDVNVQLPHLYAAIPPPGGEQINRLSAGIVSGESEAGYSVLRHRARHFVVLVGIDVRVDRRLRRLDGSEAAAETAAERGAAEHDRDRERVWSEDR